MNGIFVNEKRRKKKKKREKKKKEKKEKEAKIENSTAHETHFSSVGRLCATIPYPRSSKQTTIDYVDYIPVL